jgi:hypothetical protein
MSQEIFWTWHSQKVVGISESLLSLYKFGMNICDGFSLVPNSRKVTQATAA